MTMIIDEKVKCAVCGFEKVYSHISSTNNFEGYCLDFRPLGQAYSSVFDFTICCENCGYVNGDISTKSYDNVSDIVRSEKYREMLNSDTDEKAKTQILQAIIALENEDYFCAGNCYLISAWAFDDSQENENAVDCRRKAIKCFKKSEEAKKDFQTQVIMVDLYRRIRQFSKALKLAEQLFKDCTDSSFWEVLYYQIDYCKKGDSRIHTVKFL